MDEENLSVKERKALNRQRRAAMSVEERQKLEAAEANWRERLGDTYQLHEQFKGCPIWERAFAKYLLTPSGCFDPISEARKSWQASILQDEQESRRWERASQVAPEATSRLMHFLDKEPSPPPAPTKEEILAGILKDIRSKKGLRSWNDVAKRAGIPYQWVKKLVSQGIKGRTNKKHLDKLCAYLGVQASSKSKR